MGNSEQFTMSNFACRLLSSTEAYDEYTYKIDITNLTDTSTNFWIELTFHDEEGFKVGFGLDSEVIPANTKRTISNIAMISYPQAEQVTSFQISVEAD